MKPIYLRDPKMYGFREVPSLSQLMFIDYGVIYQELIRKTKEDDYKQRLKWLVKRGEEMVPKLDCPFCRNGKAMIFAYEVNPDGSLYVESTLTSCHKGSCKTHLMRLLKTEKAKLVESRFSQILVNGRSVKERRKLGGLYRVVFGLSKSFDDQKALRIFENGEVV